MEVKTMNETLKEADYTETGDLQHSAVILNDKGMEDYLIVETHDTEKTLKQSENIMKAYVQGLRALKLDAE